MISFFKCLPRTRWTTVKLEKWWHRLETETACLQSQGCVSPLQLTCFKGATFGECFLFPVCNGLFAFLYHVSNSWRCKTSCHLHANWPIKTITRRFSVHHHITLRDQLPVATASNHLPTGWGIHIQKATPMKNIWCLLLPQGNVKQLEKQNRAPMGSKKPESCDSYQAVSVDRDFYIRWLSDRRCKGTFFNKRENSGLTTRLYLRHLLEEQLVM